MATTPEHRALPSRRRSHRRRRRVEERRGRRHRGDREAAGSPSSSASRWRPHHEEAERDARRRDRGDTAAEASRPPPAKKPRVRSEVGLVRGCAWRLEPFGLEDDNAVGVPAAVAPTSPSSSAAAPAADNCDDGMVFAPEPAPPKGSAGAAPSSSTAAPPAPTTGVLFACQVSVPPPPPPFFAGGAAAHPPMPASTIPCSTTTKAMAIPSTSRQPHAAAIPAIPPFFPTVAPPPEVQPAADAEELRRAKVQRYAGLIAKKQQETDERYRNLLRSGQALPPPPEPPKPKPEPVVDKETLRRIAAARWRFRAALTQLERKAKEAALFVQMAPPEQLRELGIDQDMERVVSPERPRDGNGKPVVSPEHPFSPVEKLLGFFLKPE